MTGALELIEVSVDYHRGGQPVHALDSASLAIGRSESVAVMGPSGCGKTTLLRMIAGFNSIEGGTIKIDD